ncbi:MAG: hypothetical protein DRQ55_11340 [Planctomycetota bacterium]|nr:MAG: hypothetical protein DRQ55_11340 [Planctomycetota bacterium]
MMRPGRSVRGSAGAVARVRAGVAGGAVPRGQRGLALVTVIVVLVALAMIATPFALSMRNLESSALLALRRETSRSGAGVALAAARRQLEETHPFLDVLTPLHDSAEELMPDDLEQRFADLLPRDPQGAIRSVAIVDEQGKVDLARATPALLGNLLGGRTLLSAAATESSGVLAVASTKGFGQRGLALVGREQVLYELTTARTLEELRRGYPSANLERSVAAAHPAGTEVLDARLVLLLQRAWRIRPGVFEPFARLDGLKQIALFSELAYDQDTLRRVAPLLTVHGGAPVWRRGERVLSVQPQPDGSSDLLIRGGLRCGPGTLVRLRNGAGRVHYDLVTAAVPWTGSMRITLLEGVLGSDWLDDGELCALAPVPVNLNTAPLAVLEALLAGLGQQPVTDVITDLEAVHLALLINSLPPGLEPGKWARAAEQPLETQLFSRADLQAASATIERLKLRPGELKSSELAMALATSTSRRGSLRIGWPLAQELARRIHEAQPGSHGDLRALLVGAVADTILLPEQRDVILMNAVDPHDVRIVGGTAPFTYASDGVFSLTAASSEQQPNGRELARSHQSEVVSVAPGGQTAQVLSTQADFEAAASRGSGVSGWLSYPNLVASGPGLGSVATLEELAARRPGGERALIDRDVTGALALGLQPVDRAGSLLGGRAGPSTSDGWSYLSPAPARSQLAGTLHFDEGVDGLTGATPAGWHFDQGPLRLATSGTEPSLVLPSDGRPRPFTVSFWVTFQDLDQELVLFDAGAAELEDRVLIMLKDGELLLRVSDGAVPDLRDDSLPGGLPPAGEIRYGFDDGLELLTDVPYHVAAYVGGSRSSQLALFVDGFARGKRSLVTHLLEDLGSAAGPIMGSTSGQGLTRLLVESTAGFPERGALRVGEEVMEYTSRSSDEFVLAAAGTSDPFGGRGRRGTFASDHKASELVELVGYTRPLGARVALLGNGTLRGELSAFNLGQLDPARLTDEIEIEPQLAAGGTLNEPWAMGTGLAPNASTIPVLAADGSPADEGLFQSGGGYAIIFCDYGDTELVGQVITAPFGFGEWIIPPNTINGEWIGGAEIIKYDSYAAGQLSGVSRGDSGGIPESIGGSDASPLDGAPQDWVSGARTSWNDPRAFLTDFDSHLVSELSLPDVPRVLVIPVSVAVDDATDLYEGFHPGPGAASQLLQVGLDFPEGGGGTEWLRFNTVTADAFVRDDLDAVDDMLRLLSEEGMGAWDPNVLVDQGALDALSDALEFRAQAGTPTGDHPTGEQVLPVIPFGGWGVDQPEAVLGVPGRHDFVTLMDPAGQRDWNEINHAVLQDPDWSSYALVGMRGPINIDVERSDRGEDSNTILDELDIEASRLEGGAGARVMEQRGLADEASLRDVLRPYALDSRKLVRLMSGPSGELPSLAPGALHLGEDFNHRRSPGSAVIDELRLHVAGPPGLLLPPVARYLLEFELAFEEERALTLRVNQLLLPHARLGGSLLGADQLEVLSELPSAGGLLLIGEEIVAYAGLDPVETGAVFLVGRGLYGTRRAHHAASSPVTPLLFWPVTPLAANLGLDDGELMLADPTLFPAQGGLLLVGEELIGYDELLDEALAMPLRPGRRGAGLLRGRFGTQAQSHRAGSMVRWTPTRFHDAALLGDDVPAAEALSLCLRAPGAFHSSVVLKVELPDPLVQLIGRVVLDGDGSYHDELEGHPGVFGLSPSSDSIGLWQAFIGRRADRLELVLAAAWSPGAFDPRSGRSNAWKLAPRVTDVVVTRVQPTLVLEHEEWR